MVWTEKVTQFRRFSIYFPEDNFRRFQQVFHAEIRHVLQFLRITAIHKNRPAPRRVPAIHIAPPVAHHPAFRQVNAQFPGRALQHPGARLATIAFRRPLPRMKTRFHTVDREATAHFRVDGFDDFLREGAAADVRLVGGHDQ